MMNNNIWFKRNTTAFLNDYLSVFKQNYNKIVKRDIFFVKKYFTLKVINNEGNSTLNFETKELL